MITNPSTYVRAIVVSSHIANTFGAPRISSGKLTVISCVPVLAGGNLSTPVIMSPFYYDLNYNQAPQLLLESLKRYLDSLGPVCLWTIYESVVITSTIDVLLKAGLATLLEADELS